MVPNILPRLIRFRDAPSYLGMDRHRFNQEVRPTITEIRIGTQGIAFDRLDLDAWVDNYKRCSSRPAAPNLKRIDIWDENERPDSKNEGSSGELTKKSLDADFAKALALAISKKPRNT